MNIHTRVPSFSLFNARAVYIASNDGVPQAPDVQTAKPKEALNPTPAVLKAKVDTAAKTAQTLEVKVAEDTKKGFDFGGLRASFDSVVANAKQKIESAKTMLAGHAVEKQQAASETAGELKKVGESAPDFSGKPTTIRAKGLVMTGWFDKETNRLIKGTRTDIVKGNKIVSEGEFDKNGFLLKGTKNSKGKNYPAGLEEDGIFVDGLLVHGKRNDVWGESGRIYEEGEFDKGGFLLKGKVTSSDGDFREGTFVNGKLVHGKFTFGAEGVREGDFDDRGYFIRGKQTYPDGRVRLVDGGTPLASPAPAAEKQQAVKVAEEPKKVGEKAPDGAVGPTAKPGVPAAADKKVDPVTVAKTDDQKRADSNAKIPPADFGVLGDVFSKAVQGAKDMVNVRKDLANGAIKSVKESLSKVQGDLVAKAGEKAPEKALEQRQIKELMAMMAQEVSGFKQTGVRLQNAEDVAALYGTVKVGIKNPNPQIAENMNAQDLAYITDAIFHPEHFSTATDAQLAHSQLHDFFVNARSVIPEMKIAQKSPSRPRRPKATPQAVAKEGPGTRKVVDLTEGTFEKGEAAGSVRAERITAERTVERTEGESRQAKVRFDEASIKMDQYLDDTLDLTSDEFTALTNEFREAKRAYKSAHAAFETAQSGLQKAVAKEDTLRGQAAQKPSEKPTVVEQVKKNTVAGAFKGEQLFAAADTSPADQARVFGGTPGSQAQ